MTNRLVCSRLWNIAMFCMRRMTSSVTCGTTQFFTVAHIQDEFPEAGACKCVKQINNRISKIPQFIIRCRFQ